MSDIEIEIDGQTCTAAPNQMVIQVADAVGIYIPRFCYHKHLSVAANCRMCLVEVEKAPKPMPACATPVAAGMKVFTRSAKALAAQRAVMEFLLINHPLDCPICDQGGECELQDLSLGYGKADSYYCEGKRSVKDEDIGPLIATDMTRCIQCTRCVRFGTEIAGIRELGATDRGENMEITTYIKHTIQSEVSGNIIDLCPVGALTSKPYRFTARAWELVQSATIAAHDCIGSHLYAHTRDGKVMRVVPRENTALNETWISDRDRFSYEGLYHEDRVQKPMIRENGKLKEVSWQDAFAFALQGLQRTLNRSGVAELAGLISPSATLEELYLFQKLLRSVGSTNVEHRLRQSDFSDAMSVAPLVFSLNEFSDADVILLIGSQIHKEQPIAGVHVQKAFKRGAKIIAVNMLDYDFHFSLTEKMIVAPQAFVSALMEINEGKNAMAAVLSSAKKVCIVLGAAAQNHMQAGLVRTLAEQIAKKYNAALGIFTEGANAMGAWIAGAVPEKQMPTSAKAYLLLNVEPDKDCGNPAATVHALRAAEFVVSFSIFHNPILQACAHVIFPIVPFTETSGTFVNMAGDWQSFTGVANAVGEARPAWKVLRVLANYLQLSGFDYESSEEVRREVKEKSLARVPVVVKEVNVVADIPKNKIYRVGDIPIYEVDSIVRRAKALQAIQPVMEGELAAVRMSTEMLTQLQLREGMEVRVKQGEHSVRLPVKLDTHVPGGAVFVPGGIEATKELGNLFGEIEIEGID
ncbi:hypothetical protein AYO45_03715 [Gammaproteobacteria bacterium SCGC AG-212-F23]|nr:hypothetical protein AYO45_03715 [Gammaproteobacteria bacterium SCGC AG-212-F23]